MPDREVPVDDRGGASLPDAPQRQHDASHYVLGALETTEEAPALLDLPWKVVGDDTSQLSTFVSGINGAAASGLRGTTVGIRVGEQEGTGYVVLRQIDGQLAFVPDAGYIGSTRFTLTIREQNGRESTLIATVNVRPSHETANEITFVNGSKQATLLAGMNSTILGALTVPGTDGVALPDVVVFEGVASEPSTRFTVTGGRLHSLQPLDDAQFGPIHLRLDAYDDAFVFASSEIAVDVLAHSADFMDANPSARNMALAFDAGHLGAPFSDERFQFLLANDDTPFDAVASDYDGEASSQSAADDSGAAIAVELPAPPDTGGDFGF